MCTKVLWIGMALVAEASLWRLVSYYLHCSVDTLLSLLSSTLILINLFDQGSMPLSTNMIQCKIQVRHRYFIRWMRQPGSTWPITHVTANTYVKLL